MLEAGYPFRCSVQKEVEAMVVEFYTLRYLGRDDVSRARSSFPWDWYDDTRAFDRENL